MKRIPVIYPLIERQLSIILFNQLIKIALDFFRSCIYIRSAGFRCIRPYRPVYRRLCCLFGCGGIFILVHSCQNRVIKRCCLSGLRHILRRLHALQRIENCLIERTCCRVYNAVSRIDCLLRQHLPAAQDSADCCAHRAFL